MVSFILKILLVSIIAAYIFKILSRSKTKSSTVETGPKQKRFNPEGYVIKDASFSEIKESHGNDGAHKTDAELK